MSLLVSCMNMSVYVYVAVVLSRVTKKYGNKAIRKEVVPRVVYPNEGRVYLDGLGLVNRKATRGAKT